MSENKVLSDIIGLLEALIALPSLSKEEDETAQKIAAFLQSRAYKVERLKNNVWVRNRYWQEGEKVVLLNSHHDTVKVNENWTKDPFQAHWEGDQLFGLGSNDAGGPLVALLATFLILSEREDLPFNLIFLASAEEEISGANGVAAVLPELGEIFCGIVGEPTSLDVAIAEKGLVVIDGVAKGKAGHAAREEGINALYIALDDISKIRSYQFPKVSPNLGPVKLSVTQLEAGWQHNVVPDVGRFVIDVRVNECYTNQEVLFTLQTLCASELKARSLRLQSSGIEVSHPLRQTVEQLGLKCYGSPTLSDQALMSFPTIKLGPGDSARSHTADEYICRSEIISGVKLYVQVLEQLADYFNQKNNLNG
ncbi:MAG: M20 family metallo-hydrolase [Bacteroidota bacterium]